MSAIPTGLYGFSLFGDDVRHEIGGKTSIMGMYQTDMIFQSAPPFQTAKLAIVVMLYQGLPWVPQDFTLKIYLPGNAADAPAILVPVPTAMQTNAAPPNLALEPDQQQIVHFRFPIVLQPFIAEQEGFVKVRLERGGETYNLGSLRIRSATPDDAAIMPGTVGFTPVLPPHTP